MYNIFNIRKWMQVFFFFLSVCVFLADSNRYEKKLRNREVRGDEVEKQLYIGGTEQLGLYQKKRPCLLIRFQRVCVANKTFCSSLAI